MPAGSSWICGYCGNKCDTNGANHVDSKGVAFTNNCPSGVGPTRTGLPVDVNGPYNRGYRTATLWPGADGQ
jgi:hypothetical protein